MSDRDLGDNLRRFKANGDPEAAARALGAMLRGAEVSEEELPKWAEEDLVGQRPMCRVCGEVKWDRVIYLAAQSDLTIMDRDWLPTLFKGYVLKALRLVRTARHALPAYEWPSPAKCEPNQELLTHALHVCRRCRDRFLETVEVWLQNSKHSAAVRQQRKRETQNGS